MWDWTMENGEEVAVLKESQRLSDIYFKNSMTGLQIVAPFLTRKVDAVDFLKEEEIGGQEISGLISMDQ